MKTYILFLLIILVLACSRPARYTQQQPPPDKQPEITLMTIVEKWIGAPYQYGGNDITGVDCSGFTTSVLAQVYQIQLPRTAREQYSDGRPVRSGELRFADLVFFSNIRGRGINHVGIYLGDNRFVHATESSGVTISELSEDYYKDRFAGARRFISY
jgi:cell wall-associated NlpC family hydrolase